MTSKFTPQFSSVKGISDRRRLPRLGKIRLGIKVKSDKGTEYPKETDYFVCPEEVTKIFGEQPKELEIMFPINIREVIFPQAYTMYGQTKGAKCKGNGEFAMRRNEETGDWHEYRPCPCEFLEKKKCSLRGHLQFLIPKVNMGGVYQLDTGSFNSTVDVNSGIDFIDEMVGRFNMIPLTLRREQRETHADGKKQTHYTLHLKLDANIEETTAIQMNPTLVFQRKDGLIVPVMGRPAPTDLALPEPEDENPALDEGGVIITESEPVAEEVKEEPGPGPALPPPPQEKKKSKPKPKEEPKAQDPEPITIYSIVNFSTLKKSEKISIIRAILAAEKEPQPTPAPLEEHTQKELEEVYEWLFRKLHLEGKVTKSEQ